MTRVVIAVIAGWLAASGVFAFGWTVGVALHRRTCQAQIGALIGRAKGLEATQDHRSCQRTVGRVSAELAQESAKVAYLARALVAHQHHIDFLEGRGDVVGEAERIVREAGS